MATKLIELRLDEVSIVDDPANQHAHVLLFKRNDPTTNNGDNTMTPEKLAELTKTVDTLTAAVNKSNETIAALTDDVGKLRKENDELKSSGARTATVKAFRDKLPAGLHAAFDAMAAAEQDAFMTAHKNMTADDPLAKALTAITDQCGTLQKANETLANRLLSIETERSVAAIKAEYSDVAGIVDVDKLAPVIVDMRKTNKDAAAVLEDELRRAAKAARAGQTFRVIGNDTDRAPTATTKLDKAAHKVREANPGLTMEQAMDKALAADPALYDEYLAETARGRAGAA